MKRSKKVIRKNKSKNKKVLLYAIFGFIGILSFTVYTAINIFHKSVLGDSSTRVTGNKCIVSDATNRVTDTGKTAFEIAGPSVWTSISGAKWIWSMNPVSDPTHDIKETFYKVFKVINTPKSATLVIAADNEYDVSLDGATLSMSGVDTHFAARTHVFMSEQLKLLQAGNHTLQIRVKNRGVPNATAKSNPAGLNYKLLVEGTRCDPNVTAEPILTVQVYMSPTGSDNNSGTKNKPVKTISKVHDIVKAMNPKTDVEVMINQGTYTGNSVTWDTYISGHTISFMPTKYIPGSSCQNRPTFTGNSNLKQWFITDDVTGNTNLRFYCLKIQNYPVYGIFLDGGQRTVDGYSRPLSHSANGNVVYGMIFQKIGTKYVTYAQNTKKFGEAGLMLINSSNNLISNNIFEMLINNNNKSNDQEKVHGIYIKTYSVQNEIKDNTFNTISGNPVQVRNDANNNRIHNNRFTKTGHNGYLSEYVRMGAEAANGDKDCASHGNWFYDNTLVGTNYIGRRSTEYVVYPSNAGGISFTGGGPCSNAGSPLRAMTWGNVRQ